MGFVERVQDVQRPTENLLKWELPLCQQLLNRAAADVLHCDKSEVVLVADFIDCANTGVRQDRSGARLSQESFMSMPIFGFVRDNCFQGNDASKLKIYGAINFAHPSNCD